MEVVTITTHVEDALARFLQQDKEATKFKGFVSTLVSEMQVLETVFVSLRDVRYLSNATGASLERIADIVGLSRYLAELDADLRSRIYIQIVKNRSKGTPESVIDGLTLYLPGAKIQLYEYANAALGVAILNITLTQEQINNAYKIVRQLKPAGVALEFINTSPDPAQNYFTLFGDVTSNAAGFSDDTAPTSGGILAELAVEL